MPSFGENLRREREKRNVTLDQISQSTKIGTRMLQALEEDRFNQLPGGIFNKGFVRAYARCLGLDEDQTVTDYLEASGDVAPVQPEVPAVEPEAVPRVEATTKLPQRQFPWGLFAALLLLAALALSLWSRRQQDQDSSPHTVPRSSAPQSERTQSSASSVPVANTGNSASPALVSSSLPTTVTSPQPAPASKATDTVPTDANSPEPDTASPAPGTFAVAIHASGASWASVSSDGARVYSGILHPGDRHLIRARKEIVVRAGNAGGVELSFNGGELVRPGQSGEVRIIVFGPGGVISNSPPPPND